MLSPQDCVVRIQTLLIEVGFSCRNVIPKWFRSRSSKCPTPPSDGAPSSEPEPKRPQHVPPRPVSLSTSSLSSLLSYYSSDTNSQGVVTLNETMSSIQNVSSRTGSDFVPSLFGTSGGSIESTRSGASGSKSSQDESSWSLEQPGTCRSERILRW
ncbi:hypothetical protein PHMEG_00036783 [Phytophthora megakarya]|uniref:Uncharacterized protein n=1 Tax=Phytophthora megakarya TaxID=4795 RepID=A0A225ULC3_9STRA|nr:hypothetical protein PHMEG_00036783 [Phytophthora megakarya]